MPLLQEGLRFLEEVHGDLDANETTTHGDEGGHYVGPGHGGDDGHGGFGVHITYNDLYNSVVFLSCVYISGQIASRLLKMPDLVGEIICGILLGPNLGKLVG